MSKKKTTEEFKNEARQIHGNKYDYSKVNYISNKTKVCIICPEHGEFWQTPDKHLAGQGCPDCYGNKKKDLERFISDAIKVHGNKYDYSKVKYINNTTKVCIICPEHGEFWQDPHNHLKGKGCPSCSKSIKRPQKYTTQTFIAAAKEVHGDKYDYSETTYNGMNKKVKIICPEHGEFRQNPYIHINGTLCPKCAKEINAKSRRLTNIDFLKRAKEIHGDKYDYSKVKYVTAKNKVCIICPKHGEFWQTPDKHLQGNGCPKCTQPFSKNEIEILNYVKTLIGEENVIEHDRNVLDGKELDIFIPSLNVAIEYNGLYWHNKDKNYHLSKTEKCKERGIGLLQIFEDEYINAKDVVLSKIRHILKKYENAEKIMARKCIVKKIDKETAKVFLEKNHIQGFVGSSIYLGAFSSEELVAVMTFKKDGEDKWELTRFASKNNVVCQGIGGKIFKFFTKEYAPSEVKSFADRRWTINESDNLYTKIGFKFCGYTPAEYRYYSPYDGAKRQHKFGFRKQTLHKKYGLPLTMTETEMTNSLGYVKIYDCGLIKYVWTP